MTQIDLSQMAHAKSETPKPLYEQVKSYVLENIQSGTWPAHYKIPSEHTFVREMGISRMTIHRALRELTQDGYLSRIQGVGTFVSGFRQKSTTVDIKDIDIAITDKGCHHQCDVHFLQAEPIAGEFVARMGLKEGDEVFRSYMIHRENGIPVLLEDRYVNPALLPDYLDQDFSKTSVENYFRSELNMLSYNHQLIACTSNPEIHHFLELDQPQPCIQIVRRTWSGNRIVSVARLFYVSQRHQICW